MLGTASRSAWGRATPARQASVGDFDGAGKETVRLGDGAPFDRLDAAGHDPFFGLNLGDGAVNCVVQRLRRAARSEMPILLHGETGTGKELFARAIHNASPRRSGRFVAINCASIPESLIESELFGHRPGAFTGANSRGAKGLIQQADGGTLFLDEIGDMPLALQSRLLRVLAEREVTPVGADAPIRTNFRVVSATHRNLRVCVQEGAFREDLLFRLQGLSVTLPALRRRADIVSLSRRLLAAEIERIGRAVALADCAIEQVRRLPWPGNVRQLKQVLTTAAWLTDAPAITAADIVQALEGVGVTEAGFGADGFVGAAGAGESSQRDETPQVAGDERSCLLASLKRNRWNVSRTAHEFHTARTTIYRRMARLGIVQPHLIEG
jgi:transcriptional regulator with PAS, ATPase and Fis domain